MTLWPHSVAAEATAAAVAAEMASTRGRRYGGGGGGCERDRGHNKNNNAAADDDCVRGCVHVRGWMRRHAAAALTSWRATTVRSCARVQTGKRCRRVALARSPVVFEAIVVVARRHHAKIVNSRRQTAKTRGDARRVAMARARIRLTRGGRRAAATVQWRRRVTYPVWLRWLAVVIRRRGARSRVGALVQGQRHVGVTSMASLRDGFASPAIVERVRDGWRGRRVRGCRWRDGDASSSPSPRGRAVEETRSRRRRATERVIARGDVARRRSRRDDVWWTWRARSGGSRDCRRRSTCGDDANRAADKFATAAASPTRRAALALGSGDRGRRRRRRRGRRQRGR